MGGHGGLNILPQKRWNVYRFDNMEKVRKDEEAASKEEQLKREQSRKQDAEFRLEKLRQARGLAPSGQASAANASAFSSGAELEPEPESKSKLNHINLFEGIKIFDPVRVVEGKGDDERGGSKKMKMTKKEAAPRVVLPEDEQYRLGYGVAGKGVKLPWYLSRPSDDSNVENDDDDGCGAEKGGPKSSGKKTVEQLREERLKREKKEKERERALMLEKRRRESLKDGGFSRR